MSALTRTAGYPVHAAPLIGLVGRARSGKDTAAARLVERHGYTRYAFADALRRAALALDPIVVPLDTVSRSMRLSEVVRELGWEGAKNITEVRRTLQNYGCAIREIDPHFWVRLVMDSIARDRPAVVTDTRFRNEAEALMRAGGRLVRIVRPGLPDDTHVSETELADYPVSHTIYNDSDIPTLHAAVDRLASDSV